MTFKLRNLPILEDLSITLSYLQQKEIGYNIVTMSIVNQFRECGREFQGRAITVTQRC